MRVVVDLQSAQSPWTRSRGIARFSIALTQALIASGRHEIHVAINGAYDDSVPEVVDVFKPLLPASQIHTWHAFLPAQSNPAAEAGIRKAGEAVRKAFLRSLDPDFVLVTSLFDWVQHTVVSVSPPDPGIRTAVVVHDVIPYLFPDIYLADPFTRAQYEDKLAHLRQADLWLTNSENSRQDALRCLPFDGDRAVCIGCGSEDIFVPGGHQPEEAAVLRRRFGLERPFVMYNGGFDARKNQDGLVRAWALMPPDVRRARQLAIVGKWDQNSRDALLGAARKAGVDDEELVLTGYVTDAELAGLYRHCELFVYPSKYEGFGLPLVEAMRCGAPVIGGDNSSIREVLQRDWALFDSNSDEAIARKMLECLSDVSLRERLKAEGLLRANEFTWDSSAKKALDAMEAMARDASSSNKPAAARARVAYVVPSLVRCGESAAAMAGVLSQLAESYDVELVSDSIEHSHHGTVRPLEWLDANGGRFDRIVYQVAAPDDCAAIFPLLKKHPGTVVLLGDSAGARHPQSHSSTHVHSLYESYGWHVVDRHFDARRNISIDAAASFAIICAADGVVVDSRYARWVATRRYPLEVRSRFNVVPMLEGESGRRARTRSRLGIEAGEFVAFSVCTNGGIESNRRLARAWRSSGLGTLPHSRLVFLCEDDGVAWSLQAGSEGIGGSVEFIAWGGDATYAAWLGAVDVAVQAHTQWSAEEEAVTLDCLDRGVPVITTPALIGSRAAVDTGAVSLLARNFSDADVIAAIETSRAVSAPREQPTGSESGSSPRDTSRLGIAEIIESNFRRTAGRDTRALAMQLANLLPASADDQLLRSLARAAARNSPVLRPARQLIVDISQATLSAKRLLLALLQRVPPGWRVEPVVRDASGWRYARRWTAYLLGIPALLDDGAVEVHSDDVWTTLAPHAGAKVFEGHPAAKVRIQLPIHLDCGLVWATILELA